MVDRLARFLSFFTAIFTLLCGTAFAKPTPQEKVVFIAEQKKADAAFDLDILSQTQPRVAERVKFEVKERSDRIAFIRTLAGLSPAEKSEKLVEYHASALSRRRDFESKILKLPEFKEVKQAELAQKRRKYEQDKRRKALEFYG